MIMDERKKYEFLVFLAIYVIYMALMVPVGVKMPRIFLGYMEQRYGPAEPGRRRHIE
jgi:hypothetical protein